jgi:hypothetical protein
LLHAKPHLPPAHHKTSKHDYPNKPKVKGKTTEPIPDLNSNLTKSMTHHNQTKELTTWFLTFYPCGDDSFPTFQLPLPGKELLPHLNNHHDITTALGGEQGLHQSRNGDQRYDQKQAHTITNVE